MAEVGNMPLPPKLLKKGVTDMVRISDARMRGITCGTVGLDISSAAAAGGALALVKNGDIIELDVARRKLELLVSEQEIKRRRGRGLTNETNQADRPFCGAFSLSRVQSLHAARSV